jgi:signal transduction histidine kinase/predicted RNA-binding Zn ribbon-like protein
MSEQTPAGTITADPASRPGGRALAGRDRAGRDRAVPALALRNWRVPWRLIALIAIPTLVAMFFAGLRVEAAASSATAFGQAAQLATLGQQVTGLAQAMENERDLTAAFIARGRAAAGRAVLRQQYQVTGAWGRRVRALMRGVGGAFPAQTRVDATAVLARIADLPDLRATALGSETPALTVITDYSLASADLFSFEDDIAQQAESAALVGKVRALGSLSRMKDQASQQRAILQTALVQRQFVPGMLNALIAAQAQQASDLASFETSATLGEAQVLTNTVAGPPVDQAQEMEQRAIVLGSGGGPLRLGRGATGRWYADMSDTVDRMRQVERQLANSIVQQTTALHQGAMRSLLLTGAAAVAVLIFALLATVVIARSMVRPLRRLKADALDVAGVRLPAEVRQLSRAGGTGTSVVVEPIGVHSADEIGQVARAFDQVHREAVRLAADEARLRGSVSAMFVSLSRRSQSLLERLLRLIDSLELGEQDPERLADLFRMDHLATRMRRNSENLLVLAGQEPPRRWAEPVSLADVARASVSEIEQYERVVLDIQPGTAVTGNAVADVVHLLAEILENATSFSAKNTEVTVSGHLLRTGGLLINVVDSGMGMTEDRLAQVNWRLENPPPADVEVSRHMGLFAVAHLAARHGIRVRLRQAPAGGVIAHVWLPDAVISRQSTPTAWDRASSPRASALLQAVRRTARLPQAAVSPEPATVAFPVPAASPGPATVVFPVSAAGSFRGPPAEPAAEVFPAAALAAPLAIVPAAPPPPEARLPIFEAVESDWFRRRRTPPQRVTAAIPPHAARTWNSPSHAGWRTAETVLAPVTGGTTGAGLPRRSRQANLVPGSAADDRRAAGSARPAESAADMRDRLAGFQRGSRRARAAARAGQPPAGGP